MVGVALGARGAAGPPAVVGRAGGRPRLHRRRGREQSGSATDGRRAARARVPCCVIAEAGSCHDGRLDRALDLVGLARTIGADAVKFQWTSSAERLCDRRHAPEYRAAYELIAFPRPWLAILQDQAATLGLEFLCTVYLPEDVAVIAPLVARFKIASFEAEDAELRQASQSHGKPIIVSTGMTRAGQGGGVGADLVLHCVSAYPTPLEELNLACLRAP